MNRALWLLSALFIVYGTSRPFRFVPDVGFALENLGRVPLDVFAPIDVHDRVSLPDMLQNVLLFLPFGVFGYLSLGGTRRLGGLVVVVVSLGLMLSLCVEGLQLFTVDRRTSLNDVVTNTAGALLGVLAAPASLQATRRLIDRFRGSGWVATAGSLYPLLVSSALLSLAAWHPFDVTLDPGGIWADVKRLIADPLQVGALGDEGADALRYALFGAAAARWLEDVGVGRYAIAAGLAGTAAAFLLEASQLPLDSRMPGGKDVLIGAAGAWAGAIAAASPMRQWPRTRIALVVVVLAWAGGAMILLSPFDWTGSRRPFALAPFFGYYSRSFDQALSHVVELVLAFFPIGFALARVLPRSRAWPAALGTTFFLALPLEYLQGWTVTRVPDVTDVGVGMLGAGIGAWTGGALRDRFSAAVDAKVAEGRAQSPFPRPVL